MSGGDSGESTETLVDRIVCGDAERTIARWPGDFVDCLVTSPPYWRQRDYAAAPEQLGGEDTTEEYVERLLRVMRQCRRVLAPTGTCWIVLGDKYVRGELCGLPWRVALGMKADGWRMRSDVIWHKPNAMPSSAKSRPTTDHEYVFFFTKSGDYVYDADAIREPHVTFTKASRMQGGRRHFGRRGGTPEQGKNGGDANLHDGRWDQAFHPGGRNKRTVWSVPLSKFREAHFAVFPERLVATCIAAGCPEGGLVLDPFLGSGTTALAARRLGRRYLGIDCVPDYCAMAQRRLGEVP